MKKQYLYPEMTVTNYVDVIKMSGGETFTDLDNIGDLNSWVRPIG